MPTGKSEASSAILTLACPGNDLWFAFFHGFSRRRITFMRAVFAIHRAPRRDSAENRCNRLRLRKANMEIPFIMRSERFHTSRDWMLRQTFKIGIPGRVDGPIHFESSADPIEEFVLALFLGGFSRVMEANQPNAFLHERAKLLKPVILQRR